MKRADDQSLLPADADWRILPIDAATLVLTGLAAFYGQLATAMAVDGRNPLVHWRSVLLAPFYPVYFWCILLTSFVAGFPRGVLRLDGGSWQRTLRRVEGKIAQ